MVWLYWSLGYGDSLSLRGALGEGSQIRERIPASTGAYLSKENSTFHQDILTGPS
jgi:hypothetical protein